MKSKFIISLDFELFWGMQDCISLNEYKENIHGGKNAIPQMLHLFGKYGIHATWATVGYLFADNIDEIIKFAPLDNLKPTYNDSKLSTYNCLEYIGKNENEEPCFYGKQIIDKISEHPGQEIASHTYSHYYCREDGQTLEQFRADIESAKAIAKDKGYDLKTIVLPRNQCEKEYVEILTELGFIAYRDEENDWIHEKISIRPLMRILRLLDVYFPLTGQGGYIPKNEDGIINLVGSRMYKPYFKPLFFLEKIKIKRIKKQMLHAAKNGLTFHLWWHPHNVGVMTGFHLEQLKEILKYYTELKEMYGMCSVNMREAAEELL